MGLYGDGGGIIEYVWVNDVRQKGEKKRISNPICNYEPEKLDEKLENRKKENK